MRRPCTRAGRVVGAAACLRSLPHAPTALRTPQPARLPRLIATSSQYPVSSIQYQDSGFRIQVSGFRYQDSGFRYQDSGIQYPVSSIQYPVYIARNTVLIHGPWQYKHWVKTAVSACTSGGRGSTRYGTLPRADTTSSKLPLVDHRFTVTRVRCIARGVLSWLCRPAVAT